MYNYYFCTNKKNVVCLEIEEKNSPLIVRDDINIVAFQGNHEKKENFFDKIKGIGEIQKIRIRGKSKVYLCSRNNSEIKILENISSKGIYLHSSNVLFYSDGYKREYSLDNIHGIMNGRIVRTKYLGEGILGFFSEGEVLEINLIHEEIFCNVNNVIGYEPTLSVKTVTYGNWQSVLFAPIVYKFSGTGKIILQTQSIKNDVNEISPKDNIFIRTIKSVVPGADIIIP